jgi:hypothetical protein
MDATEAEKVKARKVLVLLFALTAVMVGAPVILFFLRHT